MPTGGETPTGNNVRESNPRHHGRVYVRGMFRRVWRPRSLELYADGILRYFEAGDDEDALEVSSDALPLKVAGKEKEKEGSTGETDEDTENESLEGVDHKCHANSFDDDSTLNNRTSSHSKERGVMETVATYSIPHHRVYGHRPKATMLILYARTIDATSLRDIHVGLAKGSFGFMFRGQSIEGSDTVLLPSTSCDSSDGDDEMRKNTNAGDTVSRYGRQSEYIRVDKKQGRGGEMLLRRQLNALDLKRCQAIPAVSKSQIVGQRISLNHGAEIPSARDYFCAVSRSEEADAWVVALRWAASMAKSRSAKLAAKAEALMWDNSESLIDQSPKYSISPELMQAAINYEEVKRRHHDAMKTKTMTLGDTSGANKGNNNSVLSHDSINRGKEHPKVRKRTIIVTKIHTFRIAYKQSRRVLPAAEVFFKIQTLLLRVHGDKTNYGAIERGEQRIVYRSCKDFCKLVDCLFVDIRKKNGGGKYESIIDELAHARYVAANLRHKCELVLSSVRDLRRLCDLMLSKNVIDGSIAAVDTTVRSLATKQHVCNSHALRRFLGCDPNSESNNTGPIIFGEHFAISRDVRRVEFADEGKSTDAFVKSWLQHHNGPSKYDFATLPVAVLSQNSVPFFICVLSLHGTMMSWRYYVSGIHLSLRLDVVLGLFCVVFTSGFLLGNEKGKVFSRATLPEGSTGGVITAVNDQYGHPRPNTELDLAKSNTLSGAGSMMVDTVTESLQRAPILGPSTKEGSIGDCSEKWKKLISNPLRCDRKGASSWSIPDENLFRVRGITYLEDRVKIVSEPAPFPCRGVEGECHRWMKG